MGQENIETSADPDLIPAWQDGQLQPLDKLDVHRRGLCHKAVSVFVMRGGQTLIQRRATGKYHTPGLWANTCCTHPHWQETPEDCAPRRLREELGLTGLQLTHCDRVEYRADVGGGMTEHEIVDIFRAEAPEGCEPVPNPVEVMDTRWIGLEALRLALAQEPAHFTPWLRIYLDRHSGAIFGADETAVDGHGAITFD